MMVPRKWSAQHMDLKRLSWGRFIARLKCFCVLQRSLRGTGVRDHSMRSAVMIWSIPLKALRYRLTVNKLITLVNFTYMLCTCGWNEAYLSDPCCLVKLRNTEINKKVSRFNLKTDFKCQIPDFWKPVFASIAPFSIDFPNMYNNTDSAWASQELILHQPPGLSP